MVSQEKELPRAHVRDSETAMQDKFSRMMLYVYHAYVYEGQGWDTRKDDMDWHGGMAALDVLGEVAKLHLRRNT